MNLLKCFLQVSRKNVCECGHFISPAIIILLLKIVSTSIYFAVNFYLISVLSTACENKQFLYPHLANFSLIL